MAFCRPLLRETCRRKSLTTDSSWYSGGKKKPEKSFGTVDAGQRAAAATVRKTAEDKLPGSEPTSRGGGGKPLRSMYSRAAGQNIICIQPAL